jgi:catechol 2,3-dioxygenase-like lactoylglutathione lyase family enzyme
MLHHVSVGVRDVERAASFYDAVLGALGYKRVLEFLPYAVAYGEAEPAFWVQLPQNQQVATAGNGVHISFAAPSKAAVDAFHATALAEGAKSDGEPGPRPDYSPDYYGAFIFDLDGNKLEATLQPRTTAKPKKKVKKSVKKAAKKAVAKTVKKAVKKKVRKAKRR